MTILLDESVPRLVQQRLPQLDIKTVQEMGWAGLKNGDLLKRAESQFNVFITADKKLRYQQNLTNSRLAIIVLPTNQVTVVATLLATIGETIRTIKTGSVLEIPLPSSFSQ
ncbi:MAG: DUF5615 family PIN-like protein [Nitrospira sp.]|nr:DUF5615 family PIN-like protein [Nitrospira sp.]